MSLAATVAAQVGDLRLDVDLRLGAGELVAVVGPNGAGKTTLLRVLAGLERPRSGRVVLDGDVLDDPDAGVSTPPERRPVGVVFQDALLFPHLSARDNVAYGLRTRGVGRREARRRADDWLGRVDAAQVARHRPSDLSGGERQRVALARALAPDPRLLLLDEPFAAVDVGARVGLRRLLRERLSSHGGVRVLVTHDPLEAMALASRMVVLEGGRVTQQGSIAEVAARPRSAWVATMLGVNLFHGTADGSGLSVRGDPGRRGPADPAVGGASLAAVSDVRGPAFAVVHPRAVQLHRTRPEGSARNVWPGRADAVDLEGDRVRVRIVGPMPIVAEVTPAAVAALGLGTGDEMWVSVKATEVQVYPE